MKSQETSKTWQRTRHQNLIRHKSGGYYARAYANGKEIWQSLKTSHLSVAQAKLAEFLKEHRERVSNGNGEVSAKMTFGEAAAVHLRDLNDNHRIKPRPLGAAAMLRVTGCVGESVTIAKRKRPNGSA